MKTRIWMIVLAMICLLNGSSVFAEDKAAAAKAGMDPVQMEKMKAAMAPGEAHQKLAPFAGKWNYTAQFWMTPDAPPETMTGTGMNEMVYGGRFLKQVATGTWMGEPWEGTGYTGYDNIRKEYQSIWVDSMATGIMWAEGDYDDATQTLTLNGTGSCPLTGEAHHKVRSEWKLIDKDHTVYTAYSAGKDGKEFKGMEIHYTRSA